MTTREVRQYSDPVIHRTTATARGVWVNAVCGRSVDDSTIDPRRWDGSHPALTECRVCFAAPAEPQVQHCDIPNHVGAPEPHYHLTSVSGGDTERVHWHSTPGWGAAHPALYRDIPGVFSRTAPSQDVTPTITGSNNTFTERENAVTTIQTHEARTIGDRVIHRSRLAPRYNGRFSTICGVEKSEATDEVRRWTGGQAAGGGPNLTECPICFATTEVKAESVNIHPLTAEKLREHPSFTLHSIKGQRDGTTGIVVFGCQRWRTHTILDNGGTITEDSSGVIVTIPARAEGGEVYVADRRLPRADVNGYTTAIYADPTPPDPDAEVKAAIHTAGVGNAEPFLANLRGQGFDVVKVTS